MLRGTFQIVIRLTFILLLVIKVNSVPMKRLSRMVREVYPEIETDSEGNQAQVCIVGDVVYGMDENVPAEQPCLKCKCQPPGVQCETIQCVKRPGCKAIHKPNKCCPDYQCECEHNGKIYPNGEKLETPPGGECKVCYCRGGEVQCAEVSCYIRTDCEGKRVVGTCCPKYDHCPPIDPIPNRPLYTTDIVISDSKNQFEVWPITIPPLNATEAIMRPTQDDFQEENKIPDTNSYDTTTSSYQLVDPFNVQKDAAVTATRITIQEIIPERKEIPIAAPPKEEIEPQGTLLIEEAAYLSNNSNDLGISDTDVESSEISETFQQPPPVLKVGNKLLFLKEGEFVHEKDATEPSRVITIVGAEGLQRGGVEDSGEIHEIKNESDTAVDNNITTIEQENDEENDTLSLNTAATTHILSLVKRKNKPTISTTQAPSSEATEQPIWISSSTPSEIIEAVTDVDIGNVSSHSEAIQTTSAQSTIKSTEDTSKAGQLTSISNVKHYDVITELNPAYPPLPEIMSPNMEDTSQKFETDNTENATQNKEMKILPQILGIRSNKTVPKNVSNSDWLKTNIKTLLNYNATLPDDLLKQIAPTDVGVTDKNGDVAEISTEIPDSTTLTEFETNNDEKIDKLSTVESRRSVETMEDSSEGSREVTTPRNKHASLVSSEDASVESPRGNSSEADDMIEPKEGNVDDVAESTTMRGLIDHVNENNKNETDVKEIDVEFVDTTKLKKQKPILEKALSEDHERERSPRSKQSEEPLSIKKRDSTMKDDEVDEELTEENFGSDEKKREADAIFRELLEDTSTLKPPAAINKDIETLSRASNALEQLSLSGGTTDTNILGILSNFFSSQYRD